jgi:2-methylcitrate dehydratase PrpD
VPVPRNSTTAPHGPTGRLATWVADFSLTRAPSSVRDRAKHLLLDGLGCALVGAQLPWSRTAVDAVLAFEAPGDTPIFGWGAGSGPAAAAVLNGTFIQGFELDDFHPRAPLHSNALLVPALLAAAHLEPSLTGERLLGALIAGYETGPRVGLALHGGERLTRGWHSGPVFGTISAAAAVSNLLGLDPAATEDALGLGATQSHGLMAAQFGAMSKRMHHGFASRNGLYAAMLARGGYTGIKQVFEVPYGGFLSVFGEGHDPDASQIDSELGERWETEQIAVKPYAAMGGLHAAIDAAADIRERRALHAEEIASVDVELSDAVYHHGWWPPERPLTPTGAQMNIGYVLAVAILDREVLAAQFSASRLDSDDVWDLVPRITAHHNPDFDHHPDDRGKTVLKIRFTDGETLESRQQAARSILDPPGADEITAKYRHMTRDVIGLDRQRRIEQLVLSIDTLPGLQELESVLAERVNSPFDPPRI